MGDSPLSSLRTFCVFVSRRSSYSPPATTANKASQQFLDRVNIGNARIQGLEADLGLQGLQFNWALSIFYIVYLLVEVPSNIILKRVGPRLYLPGLVVGFGLVSLCTAFVTSYAGLMVARVFLGIFEGGAMPGSMFLFS